MIIRYFISYLLESYDCLIDFIFIKSKVLHIILFHPIAPFPLFRYISIVGNYSYGKQYGYQVRRKTERNSWQTTTKLKEAFTELLEDNIGKVQELFDKVAEKNLQKALELLLTLSECALPRLRAIEVYNEPEDKHTALNINIIDTGVPLASS
mgnify:CR=1 FL=1